MALSAVGRLAQVGLGDAVGGLAVRANNVHSRRCGLGCWRCHARYLGTPRCASSHTLVGVQTPINSLVPKPFRIERPEALLDF